MSWKWERPLSRVPKARLVVSPKDWWIQAYFPGPDLRYNGTSWSLAARDLRSYVKALRDAWTKLEELERVAPPGADLSTYAARNIKVVVKGYPGRGVTLHHHHGLIPTAERLDGVLQELEGLPEEAADVQRRLGTG